MARADVEVLAEALVQVEIGQRQMKVGRDAGLGQGVPGAVEVTPVEGQYRPAAAGLPNEGGDITPDPGDTRHLAQTGPIDRHGHVVGELGDVGTARTAVHEGSAVSLAGHGGHCRPALLRIFDPGQKPAGL